MVGSDGGNSKVRQLAQLRTVFWSYKQRGLVATVATDEPNYAALQVFLPKGPLALLPVRDGFSNIVWSTTPAQAAELEAMSPDQFVSAVNTVNHLVTYACSHGDKIVTAVCQRSQYRESLSHTCMLAW